MESKLSYRHAGNLSWHYLRAVELGKRIQTGEDMQCRCILCRVPASGARSSGCRRRCQASWTSSRRSASRWPQRRHRRHNLTRRKTSSSASSDSGDGGDNFAQLPGHVPSSADRCRCSTDRIIRDDVSTTALCLQFCSSSSAPVMVPCFAASVKHVQILGRGARDFWVCSS